MIKSELRNDSNGLLIKYAIIMRSVKIMIGWYLLGAPFNRRPVKSPLEKVWSDFFLQKSVLMGRNFIPKIFWVVIGSSCRSFLQPKKRKIVL